MNHEIYSYELSMDDAQKASSLTRRRLEFFCFQSNRSSMETATATLDGVAAMLFGDAQNMHSGQKHLLFFCLLLGGRNVARRYDCCAFSISPLLFFVYSFYSLLLSVLLSLSCLVFLSLSLSLRDRVRPSRQSLTVTTFFSVAATRAAQLASRPPSCLFSSLS